MKENIKIGIIGLGQRGDVLLENPIIPMMKDGAGIEITAVCDRLPDRVAAAAEKLEKAGFPRPIELTDYKEMLKIKELDAVYIAVSWETHAEVAGRHCTRVST